MCIGAAKMRRERYLWRRGELYSFQMVVPVDLRSHFKTRRVVIPLKTDSLADARKRRDQLQVECQRTFEHARRGTGLTIEEVEEEALRVYRRLLSDMAQQNPSVDDVKAGSMNAALELIDANEPHEIALATARAAAFQGRLRMLRGEPSSQPVNFSGEIDPITLRPIGPPEARGDRGMRFTEAGEGCIAALVRDGMRQATINRHRRIQGFFLDYAGDLPISDISRRQASEFLNHVGKTRKLTNRSLRQYTAVLSSVFKWARRSGHFEGQNPFSEHAFRPPRDTGWLPYNDDELRRLFSGPMFQGKIVDPLAWCMWIALYSGLRLNEVAQLRVEDLRQEHGIWIFDIREGDGKSLKTHAATRQIPVHSWLIAIELLEYREGLPEGQLFPTLRGAGADKKLGWYLGQRFTEYRRRCGVNRARLSFHSFRKAFTTSLDRAGVSSTDAAALLGHQRGFTFSTYSSGPGLARLRDLVEKVNYGALEA
jgi:integrase